jgi:hypothetical protein
MGSTGSFVHERCEVNDLSGRLLANISNLHHCDDEELPILTAYLDAALAEVYLIGKKDGAKDQ